MTFTLVNDLTVEPVGVADFKAHSRVVSTGEDARIAAFISAARVNLEKTYDVDAGAKTYKAVFDGFPAGRVLGFSKVGISAITELKVVDGANPPVTITSGNYFVRLSDSGAEITFVDTYVYPVINYASGSLEVYFTTKPTQDDIKQAILLLAAHYYENREATAANAGAGLRSIPFGVAQIMQPYKRYSL